MQGQSSNWVVVEFRHPNPSNDDWVGVFSPSGFRYSTDYGMFRLCIANTEEDWGPGTEQYKFIDRSSPGSSSSRTVFSATRRVAGTRQ